MITLPVQLNPISRRKDRSVKLSFETRELQSDEILTLMALEGQEMWLCLKENDGNWTMPAEPAELDTKSQAERIRNVMYILYKQDSDSGAFVGSFNAYYNAKTERYIEFLKEKIKN